MEKKMRNRLIVGIAGVTLAAAAVVPVVRRYTAPKAPVLPVTEAQDEDLTIQDYMPHIMMVLSDESGTFTPEQKLNFARAFLRAVPLN
jgi:hypothetical protein